VTRGPCAARSVGYTLRVRSSGATFTRCASVHPVPRSHAARPFTRCHVHTLRVRSPVVAGTAAGRVAAASRREEAFGDTRTVRRKKRRLHAARPFIRCRVHTLRVRSSGATFTRCASVHPVPRSHAARPFIRCHVHTLRVASPGVVGTAAGGVDRATIRSAAASDRRGSGRGRRRRPTLCRRVQSGQRVHTPPGADAQRGKDAR